MRTTLCQLLGELGYHAQEAADSDAAFKLLSADSFDVVLTCLINLKPLNGMELLRRVRQSWPSTPVILMTSSHSFDGPVRAMEEGAVDFLFKPFTEDELVLRIDKAVAHRRLEQQALAMAESYRARYRLDGVVAQSAAMREVLALATRAARENTHVHISGAAGTGKAFLARAIHAGSTRADKPFWALKCKSLGREHLDRALFGSALTTSPNEPSERGLLGRMPEGSVLLADMDGDRGVDASKLQEVMEHGYFSRSGDDRRWATDARILVTTIHRPPSVPSQCNAPTVFSLPPLRERREDIPMWVDTFLNQLVDRFDTPLRLGPGVLEELVRRDYPGNLDELRILIERGARLARDGTIDSNAIRVGVG
jgi:two-component system response regulator HydG